MLMGESGRESPSEPTLDPSNMSEGLGNSSLMVVAVVELDQEEFELVAMAADVDTGAIRDCWKFVLAAASQLPSAASLSVSSLSLRMTSGKLDQRPPLLLLLLASEAFDEDIS